MTKTKKSLVIVLLLILTSAFLGCSKSIKSDESNLDKHNNEYNIMMEKIKTLRKDMRLEEAIEIMGGAGEPAGSGSLIIRYNLPDKSYVNLNFGGGDKLRYVTLYRDDGSEQELLD